MPAEPAPLALITGASGGIGGAVARELARRGWDLLLHYRTDRSRAEEVAAAVRALGREAALFSADLSRPAEASELVAAAARATGPLRAVITCAGIFEGPSLAETGPEEWRRVQRTDLDGTFFVIQAAVSQLRNHAPSAVVTLSSVLASRPARWGIPYQSANAGIEQLTRSLAVALAPHVRVNCVAPGYIRTEMNRGAWDDPAEAARVAEGTPLRRWGEADDVATVVAYFVGAESSWVTGAVVPVDGGIGLV